MDKNQTSLLLLSLFLMQYMCCGRLLESSLSDLKYYDNTGNEFFKIRDTRGDVHVFGAFWDMRQREYTTKNAGGCFRSTRDAMKLRAQIQENVQDDRRRRLWWFSRNDNNKNKPAPDSSSGKQGFFDNIEAVKLKSFTGNETKKILYVGVYLAGPKELLRHKLNHTEAEAVKRGTVDYRMGTCELHYSSGRVQQVPYRIQKQRREIDKPRQFLIGAYAICDMCAVDQSRSWPTAVAIVPKNYVGVNQIISIRGNRDALSLLIDEGRHENEDVRRDLAVCVRPLFGEYSNYAQISGFLMYYSMVGVSHFVIYNGGAATPKLLELLNTARNVGLSIELRQWVYFQSRVYENYEIS